MTIFKGLAAREFEVTWVNNFVGIPAIILLSRTVTARNELARAVRCAVQQDQCAIRGAGQSPQRCCAVQGSQTHGNVKPLWQSAAEGSGSPCSHQGASLSESTAASVVLSDFSRGGG